MIIILVHWQIRPGREEEFLAYWRGSAIVRDRSGLIGEFLSRVVPGDPVALPWITWSLPADSSADAIHYANVGLWRSEQEFVAQIAGDFGDDRPIAPFELHRRRRLLLAPQAWRIGRTPLPPADSRDVL
jgi:hypothetical protein